MTLPTAASARTLQHRRSIDIKVYARGDGLWEVDAHLTDIRTREALLPSGRRAAGEPIHEMLLRLVIDERFNIVESGAETRAMPYEGMCDNYGAAYASLLGLNLMRRFRQGVQQRLGGVLGCTHITELTQTLPTAVVQAFAGIVIDTRGEAESAKQPFQIDRCHALRADGEVVRLHYPRWYRQGAVSSGADTAPRTAETPPTPQLQQETSR
jgi:hypothetical protein